jgi:serine/threonine-protein kinase
MAVSAAIVADPPTSLRELQPGVPESLEQVVLKALAKTPDARWPDVQSLAAALAPFAGGRVSILPSGARERLTSSPSLASGPTLAAPTPGISVSPMAHTEAAVPGATPAPVITAGNWAAQPVGTTTRPRRGRTAFLAALAAVPLVAIAVGAVVVLRPARVANDGSIAAASVAAPPAASSSALAAATAAPADSASSVAVAVASSAPAVRASVVPRGRPVSTAPATTPVKPVPQLPTATPTTPANPVRL